MLLYIYPKVVSLQYCVSVGRGVVSLTKGTSGFPLTHSLFFCQVRTKKKFIFLISAQVRMSTALVHSFQVKETAVKVP
nr:hypothetical protein [Eubacterium sp.]